jgi:hypothetical protein
VEAALQTECRFVAHALVLATGHMSAPVVLVAPHVRELRSALPGQAQEEEDDAALLRSAAAEHAVLADMRDAGRRAGLERWEVPTKARAHTCEMDLAMCCCFALMPAASR